jgi:hypothetical protein
VAEGEAIHSDHVAEISSGKAGQAIGKDKDIEGLQGRKAE